MCIYTAIPASAARNRRHANLEKRPITFGQTAAVSRSLIGLAEDLRGHGIGFRSLNERAIDTTSASGELIFNIFSALTPCERRLIQERTKAGLAAARARGRCGGRPRLESEQAKVRAAKKLFGDKSITIDDISRTLGILRSTYYRKLSLGNGNSKARGQKTQPNCNSLPSEWLWHGRILAFGRRWPLALAAANLIKSSDGRGF